MWLEICSVLHWKAHLVLLWLLGACIGGGLIKDKSILQVGLVASETTSFHLHAFSSSEDPYHDLSSSSTGGGGNGATMKFLHSSGKRHRDHQSTRHRSSSSNNQQNHFSDSHPVRHNHHQQQQQQQQENLKDDYSSNYPDFSEDGNQHEYVDGEDGENQQTFTLLEQLSPGENPGDLPVAAVHEKLRSSKGTSSASSGVHSTSGGGGGGGTSTGIGGSSGLDHHHFHQKPQSSQMDDDDDTSESGSGGNNNVLVDGGSGGESSSSSSSGGDFNSPQEGGGVIKEQQEKLLLQQLMRGYERDVRPVRNASHAVVVQVGITLTQIFDMDEKNQVLTTNVWLDQEWNDELLRWDPKDFSGLEEIRIPCERIWLPDIVLYNNADDYTRGYMPSRAMVRYDGKVFWPPPTKFRSTCGVDVTYFPFDDQTCTLKLGSWTYNGYQVDVTKLKEDIDLDNYVTNGEWDLLRADLTRNVVVYPCCPEPFPDVTVTLVIRRKTLYYIYNIVLPCMMLSALTLLVFCLPPDSGEKIALGITVLLAFSVFMLAISEALPETSESIPLIGIYLTAVMAITSISVIVTVVVLNLHYLGPRVRPVPTWLKCLLPEDDVNFIRQKSLLIPAARRQPKSGSLKRSHVYMPPTTNASGGATHPDKHSAYDNTGGDDGITECSSTESVNNERKSTTTSAAPGFHFNYNDDMDSTREARRRHNTTIANTRQNPISSSGAPIPSSAASMPSPSHNDASGNTVPASSATTIAAAAIAAAATRGGGGLHHPHFPLPAANNTPTGASTTDAMCEDLVNAVRYLMNIQEQVESQNVLVAEWRLVAQAVDRILFWIFAVMTIVSSTVLLLILPLYKRSTYYGPTMPMGESDFNGTDAANDTLEWNLTSTTEETLLG